MVTEVLHEDVETRGKSCCGVRVTGSWLRDSLVFLAGAQAFHTLSHVYLGFSGMLPVEMHYPSITVTQEMNVMAIVINGLITVGLLYAVRRVGK